MKLLWNLTTRYKKLFYAVLALTIINQVFSLADPQIIRLIIDNYASKIGSVPQADFIRGVIVLLLLGVGAALISRLAKNFQDYYTNVITQRVGTRLYAESIAHSFAMPYRVFEDQRSGELLQILQRARNDAQVFMVTAVNIVFFALVGIVIVIGYAFTVHWIVGTIYVLLIPALGLTTMLLSGKIKAAQKAIVAQTADLAGSTTETIRNVELVKSLGLDAQETARLNQVNDSILKLELRKIVIIRKFSFVQGTLVNAMRSGLMFAMLWLIAAGAMTLGQFLTLLFYSFFIFNPLSNFGDATSQYQEAKGSMEALQKILDTPVAAKPDNPVVIDAIERIEFKDVSFAYENGGKEAVEHITLALRAGTSTAFVGPSGAGKTTLVKLLVGLYEPTKGNLLVNGIDSRAIDLDGLRRRIGYVSQDTQLFAGTIRENLLFVNPDATDGECMKAIEQAAAASILSRTGEGLDTRIGESGIKVSGGERQRLAIARALLRNPDIIIFDEATSSLDSMAEKAITETIREIGKSHPELMMIMVAHRLSTIAHADTIFVLERGKVIEEGTHASLLEQKGLYAALWREQIGERSEVQLH